MMQNMQRDPSVFADVLSAMAEEELYEAMRDLETKSEELSRAGQDTSDVLARIAQVETEIETRFPGQKLAPYKNWKRQAG